MGAYSWLAFFVSIFVSCFIFYFMTEPILSFCIETAILNQYDKHIKYSNVFYNLINNILLVLPPIMIIVLAVGYLVQSNVEKRDDEF